MMAKIQAAKSRSVWHQGEVERLQAERGASLEEARDFNQMLEIARKAATMVQDSLATNLSGIVTKALETVFGPGMEFKAEFVERRGVSECDLYILQDGEKFNILKSRGGGLADVVSVTLQMAFIMMSPVKRVLITDEIARHVDSEAQDLFAIVLKDLCQELGFTIITVTHAGAFVEVADRVYKVSKKGGISHVIEDH